MSRWALLISAWVLAMSGAAWAEPPEAGGVPPEVAVAHFDKGTALYSSRNYADALVEFRRSYELSRSPNAALAVARCLRGLMRLPEAVLAYEEAVQVANAGLREKSTYAPTLEAARAELAELASRVARVRVRWEGSVDRPLVRVNGRALSPAELRGAVVVMPGPVTVEAEAPGFERVAVESEASAGSETTVQVPWRAEAPEGDAVAAGGAVPPPGDGGSGWRWAGWVSLGVGALLFGGFVVFYVLAEGQHGDLVDACVKETCAPGERRDLETRGETYQLLTNVSLGAGIVAGVLGALFLVLAGTAEDGHPRATARDGSFRPRFSVDGVGLEVAF